MHVNEVKALADRIRTEIGKAVIGQDGAVDLLLTAVGSPGTELEFAL